MKFYSPFDEPIRVASTTGHVILIDKEPREIPPQFVRQAVAEGAVPEGVPVELMQATDKQPAAADHDVAIRRALRDMKAAAADGSGAPDEFTANGLPSVPALSKRVGFKVSREQAYAAWEDVSGDAGEGSIDA